MCSFTDTSLTTSQQWPRTLESAATATAPQEPAPRRMVASAATVIALQVFNLQAIDLNYIRHGLGFLESCVCFSICIID